MPVSPTLLNLSLGLLALLSLPSPALSAHSQWVKLTITNAIPKDQDLQVSLSDFKLKWGHFYDCHDEKRQGLALEGSLE